MVDTKRRLSLELGDESRKRIRGAMSRLLMERGTAPQRAAVTAETCVHLPFKVEEDDALKVSYLKRAMTEQQLPEIRKSLDPDLVAALEWAAGKTAGQINGEREIMMDVRSKR